MKKFYPLLSHNAAVNRSRGRRPGSVTLFIAILCVALCPFALFGQAPTISYSGPQVYTSNAAIPALVPVSTAVAAPGYHFPVFVNSVTQPRSLAVDAAGNKYVIGDGNPGIALMFPAGSGGSGTVTSFGIGLNCIAVDGAGNVYVTDPNDNNTVKKNHAGSTPVSIGSGFLSPQGISADAAGNIYVGDVSHRFVKKIPVPTAVGSDPPVVIGPQFILLGDIAADGAGNVYAIEYANQQIGKIDRQGNYTIVAAGFNNATGIAADAVGNVYVADSGNGIIKIPADGSAKITLASGSFRDVAIDGAGNVYVADYDNNAVEKISLVGGYYISPMLPAGLNFNTSTGIISGTPTSGSPATNYTITAYNTQGSASTTVNIATVSYNANLAGLALSSGTLTPVFSAATNNYTASVANGIGAISVTPFADDVAASVKINGASVNSGAASADIPLNIGDNTITVAVTSQGGAATNTYTIIVNRLAPISVSYSGPQVYSSGVAIAALVPASTAVAAPGYGNPFIAGNFTRPHSLAVDAAGNKYVIGDGNPAVAYVIPAGNTGSGTLTSSGNALHSVAVDGAGNVYVSDPNSNAVKKNHNGSAPVNIGSGFDTPQGLSADPAGNIYVSDWNHGLVKKIPVSGGSTVAIGPEFNNIGDVAADGAGNVYAIDNTNSSVVKIPLTGYATAIATGLNKPFGIAADAVGNVYVAENPAANVDRGIIKIPADGAAPFTFGSGFLHPLDVAVDGAGNVYVADNGHNAIKEISPVGGYYISPMLPPGLSFDTGTGIISGTPAAGSPPTNYTVTAYNANSFASTTINIRVVSNNADLGSLSLSTGVLSPSFTGGTTSYSATVHNAVSSITITPTAVSTSASITINGAGVLSGSASVNLPLNVGNNIFTILLTSQDGSVQKPYTLTVTRLIPSPVISYNGPQTYATGTSIAALSPVATVVAAPGTSWVFLNTGAVLAHSAAVDAVGNVYVADAIGVKKIPVDGSTPVSIGTGFGGVVSVAVDGAGNVYVADQGNKAIKKINVADGSTVTVLSGVDQPGGVAVDAGGNVYASSKTSAALYKVAPGGSVSAIGAGFNGPAGIAVDAAGNVYVADQNNGAIKKINAIGGGVVPLVQNLNYPSAVAVDDAGNVYFTAEGAGEVGALLLNGNVVTLYTAFNQPSGIAVDAARSLFVTARGDNTVRKFTITGGYFISPALPAGLDLDPATGIISGTPTASGPATNYTVRAYNIDGYGTALVNIKTVSSNLANLQLSSGALTPAFATATTGYTVNVPNATASITITPTTADVNSTVKVKGTAVTSGSASGSLPLNVGDNNIPVVVTAQDGTTTTTYTVTVNRAPSSNAGLSNISISQGALSPAFVSGITDYAATVKYAITTITVTPFTSDAGATVTVNGTTLTSGSASASIPLNVGSNNITIACTAQDGVTQLAYHLVITRLIAPPVISYSPQAYTSGIAITPLVPASSGVSSPDYGSAVTIGSGLGRPAGVAVDAAGNGYLADSFGAIKKIPVDGGSPVTLASGLSSPTGIAADAAGNVYFTEQGINSVKKIPAGGGSPVVIASCSQQPHGIAVDASGNVYVAQYGGGPAGAVIKIPAGGGSQVIVDSGFVLPEAVAVDGLGNIYVADANHQVYMTPVNGGSRVILAAAVDGLTGIAVDGAGNVYFTDLVHDGIGKVPAGGGAVVRLSSGLASPGGVAIDASGNLYVSESVQGRVKQVSPVGGYFISKTLPAGLNFSSITGIISGTPVTGSSASYTVTAYNTGGGTPAGVNINTSYNTGLSGLQPSLGTLTPALAPGVFNYSVNLPHSTIAVSLTPAVLDPSINIQVDGLAVQSGTPSHGMTVGPFPSFFEVVITAPNGQSSTYLIAAKTITSPAIGYAGPQIYSKGIAITALAPSNSGGPVDPGSYHIAPALPGGLSFDNNTGIISGTPTVISPAADYTVTTANINGGNSAIINITVASNIAGLDNLVLSSGALSPAFATGTISYTASVANDIASITVTPTTSDTSATVTVNGTTVISGSASGSISLSAGDNTITTIVTAQDGTTIKMYTLTVTRAPSVNANLSNLETDAGLLTPGFANAVTGYTMQVGNAVTSIAITPTTADTTALVTVNGTTVISGSASGSFPLSVGDNTITTIVTAQDGTTIKMYTLTVTRAPSANADLSNLETDAGALTPGFANAVTGYTMQVGNAVTSIAITPTTADTTAVVTVNGTTVISGSASGSISLSAGDNTITAEVTAQDGVTTKTYAITVTRAASADATLAGLNLDSGTLSPVFAATKTAYTAMVGNATASVTITPVTNNNATVKVNDVPVVSGATSASIPLAVGANAITLVVTAQDGVTTKTYTVTVTRVSNNALLNAIKISPATTLTVVSGPDYKDYTTTVPISQTSVKITPIAQDAAATIKVNGVTVASGAASAAIPLNVGDNVINTVVTAQDGVTKNAYSIKFSRLANADLANLTLSSGVLSPVFAAGTTSYTAMVSNATASVTVKPTATDAAATIKVNGVTVANGTASAAIPLNVGINVINTVVAAQDGITAKTYTLTVTRVSTNALLNVLKATPATALTLVSGPDYKDYTTVVPNSQTSVKITPTAQDAAATIKVNGVTVASGAASSAIPLNVGDNVINTVVTAQDGVTKNTYSIKFIRVTKADLVNLTLSSGVLSPAFTAGTTAYTATVSNATASVTVTPTTGDAAATVKVNGVAIASGTASPAIALIVGPNIVTTEVPAADGVTAKTYTVTITRVSTNALLNVLKITPATALTVVSGADYKDYITTVPNSQTSVKITPTAQDATATIKVNGVTVASGTASAAIALNVGDNVINTVVTAQDGVTKNTYSIKFTRQAPTGAVLLYTEKADPVLDNSVLVRQNVSPNGDGNSDVLVIEGIAAHPDNKLQIMNRNGALVYEAKGYDNTTKVFDGHSSTNGKLQQAGTYFYSLDYKDGAETKHKTGFIVLKY